MLHQCQYYSMMTIYLIKGFIEWKNSITLLVSIYEESFDKRLQGLLKRFYLSQAFRSLLSHSSTNNKAGRISGTNQISGKLFYYTLKLFVHWFAQNVINYTSRKNNNIKNIKLSQVFFDDRFDLSSQIISHW